MKIVVKLDFNLLDDENYIYLGPKLAEALGWRHNTYAEIDIPVTNPDQVIIHQKDFNA